MNEKVAATAVSSTPNGVRSSARPGVRRSAAPADPNSFLAASKRQLRAAAWPTLIYLTKTEVHTYAFSVAANVILSFFPFIVLLMTLMRRVFHSPTMLNVIAQVLRDSLPSNQDFIVTNLQKLSRAHNGVQVASLIMLLVSSTGVFMPLEVALNQVWGFRKNRSYLHNQAMALGLAFFGGAMALLSIAMTSGSQHLLQAAFGSTLKISILEFAFEKLAWVVMKIFAICASIAVFFVIYWVLPYGKVKARDVFPAAVVAGLFMEVAKYIYILVLPLLDFREAYGPFSVSVTLMFWAFIGGLLLFGGAHLSAASRVEPPEDPERDLV
jgi:YihY family inner membrane protein